MRAWGWMTGGLVVWGAHFLGVYVIASIADVVATADDLSWRVASLVFSGLCLAAALGLLVLALGRLRRQGDKPAFGNQLAALGTGVSAIAIVWQALPNLIGY